MNGIYPQFDPRRIGQGAGDAFGMKHLSQQELMQSIVVKHKRFSAQWLRPDHPCFPVGGAADMKFPGMIGPFAVFTVAGFMPGQNQGAYRVLAAAGTDHRSRQPDGIEVAVKRDLVRRRIAAVATEDEIFFPKRVLSHNVGCFQ
ncbi:hypothetical protein SDC9_171986 [bioreactor metagenome]|uniref:Uncharacterized protein n=1 Tax=bioreactor metagenome TaxID=1076179 RepID=A0A645GCF7_9ZZZZ